jgi:hypothetical protein
MVIVGRVQPILDNRPRHAAKLGLVGGNQGQALCQGTRGDEQLVGAILNIDRASHLKKPVRLRCGRVGRRLTLVMAASLDSTPNAISVSKHTDWLVFSPACFVAAVRA